MLQLTTRAARRRAGCSIKSNPRSRRRFPTRKTVETYLGHVYAKLNIAGRGQLGGVLDALETSGTCSGSSRRSHPLSVRTFGRNDRRPQTLDGLYVLCLGMLMIVLDATIVNVALPSIQDDLGFSQSDLAWVVNAYLIAFGGLLLLAGRLGDLVGQRRVFLIGLAVFTAASLVCALAQSQGVLVGARFVQGIGGALTPR